MQRKGRYSDKCIDFDRYIAPFFKISPSSKFPYIDTRYSCGVIAFYTLTGKMMDLKYRHKSIISDKVMIQQLRKIGLTVIPMSISNTLATGGTYNHVRSEHVILVTQLMFRGEGSWAILYKNRYYHSFSVEPLRAMEFINRPINTAYLIYKEEWGKKKETKHECVNGYHQVTLGNMTYLVTPNTYTSLQPYLTF